MFSSFLHIFKNDCKKMLESIYADPKEDFVPLAEDSFQRTEDACKLIAFYLPQYHSIPLNDQNFGRGFTDWNNVAKARPQFVGHYQPQLPIDVGFYDLSHDDVMYRQIELAKQYGLYGFCFHYYWFSGKRLLEKPIFNYLDNKELDFPFCLCWANENWSTLWDGGTRNVIMEQKMEKDTYQMFLNDILPFFRDKRYITINGAPLLIIYRPSLFGKADCLHFITRLQAAAREAGFPRLHILAANFADFTAQEAADYQMDGIVEFPPHGCHPKRDKKIKLANEQASIGIRDMKSYICKKEYAAEPIPPTTYRSCFPSWDNTARKTYSRGLCFNNETPDLYCQWLTDLILWTKQHKSPEEQFVFINAWNEWAEGAHLEPDQRYGYAYLAATRKAMENTCPSQP